MFTLTDVVFGCMVGAFLGVLAGIWLTCWWTGIGFSVAVQPVASQDVDHPWRPDGWPKGVDDYQDRKNEEGGL